MIHSVELSYSYVVPYIGTWIETRTRRANSSHSKVVPYIGTWIETGIGAKKRQDAAVVPYIGTWIETEINDINEHVNLRRTLYRYVD